METEKPIYSWQSFVAEFGGAFALSQFWTASSIFIQSGEYEICEIKFARVSFEYPIEIKFELTLANSFSL